MKVKAPTKETLQKAHDEGCSDVKKVLENMYPDFFKKGNAMEMILAEFGNMLTNGEEVSIEKECIKIRLPNCNVEWTLEAFDYVKKVCNKYPKAYPEHYEQNDNSNYLYINCKKIQS